MFNIDNAPGRTALVNGKEYLFFSGYSYLGMGGVPAFIAAVKEGIDLYGLLYPSARISNTRLNLYHDFEKHLSTLTGFDNTVSFSSGYLAGRAVAELFINNQPCIILQNTHPVLKMGKACFEGDTQDLINTINNSNEASITLVSDSVNPLQASISDYSYLTHINPNKKVICIIDDSHGIGIIGKHCKGISSFLPDLPNITYIVTYSLSKAFHINGGAVSSTTAICEQLQQSTFYTGSTPIAPSMVYAFGKCFTSYIGQQQQLQYNINYFGKLINNILSVSYYPNLPVFILNELYDDAFFKEHGIIISSFSYPDPNGKKINRVIVNALHTKEDLKILAGLLQTL